MKKVFIINGYGGQPNGGWRPWLMDKLGRQDIWACALPMPTPDNPKKDEWVAEISRQVGHPSSEIFLVGHSLGVPAILNYVDSLPVGSKIGGLVLVSGIIHVVPDKERYIPINHFYEQGFNFKHIKDVCEKMCVIHAKDDKNVPYEQALELSNALACDLITLEKGGHLNGSSGVYELPDALKVLQEMMN